jgi:hypothetical protein
VIIGSLFWSPLRLRSTNVEWRFVHSGLNLMLRVKPEQIWKVRVGGTDAWRPVRVVHVAGDYVVLEYLDASKILDLRKTFTASQSIMLLTAAEYQFVTNGSHKSYRCARETRAIGADRLGEIIESQ